MAYETYSTVSWADGTPISSDRLQQMSSNTDLVKTVTDNYARGILSYKSTTAAGSAITDSTSTVLITLDNQGAGLDYRLTAATNRFIKITFNTPGLELINGDENYNYYYRLWPSTDGTGTHIAEWNIGIPGQDAMTGATVNVLDTPGGASKSVLLASGLTAMTAPKKVGGGTFAVLVDSGATGITNQTYSITVARTGGTASYKRIGDSVPTQLYAEDCGASV